MIYQKTVIEEAEKRIKDQKARRDENLKQLNNLKTGKGFDRQ